MCRSRQAIDVDDGTMCLIASSPARSLGSEGDGVAQWSMERKLLEAARRATPKLPPEMREQFASLFSGANLAITCGVLAVWGASHLIGVGEVVDAGLVVVGTIVIGWQAFQAGRDIGQFLLIAANAQSSQDLDRAANFLARAVVTIGVTAFIALIMKATGKSKTASPVVNVEGNIIAEVKLILSSAQLRQIRTAQAAGKGVTLKIGTRTIQYEPGFSDFAITNFGENGFTLGRAAFKSDAELVKTLLWELYRLETSQVGHGTLPKGAASMQEVISAETKAAEAFAERVFAKSFSNVKK